MLEDITQEDVARVCFSSLSHLQKMFRYAFSVSVGEYVTKRRLTSAAHDLVNTPITVTEAAMKYRYNSPEVFTRAFTKVWGTTPSKFRGEWQFTNLYPKISLNNIIIKKGEPRMNRRKFDITELYGYLKTHADCIILSFDTANLSVINKTHGRDAGDAVIVECLRRIDSAADPDMILFRIGGDEFVLLTGTSDPEKAAAIAETVTAQNNTAITVNNTQIPVSMRTGSTILPPKTQKYEDIFKLLSEAPRDGERKGTF